MAPHGTIVSTGSYLPEIELGNDTLRRQLAHAADFIAKMEERTGIRKRWYVPEDWTTSDVGLPAARQALDDAVHAGKLKPGDLLVMCASGGGSAMAASAFCWA